ncbi:site-2 protease family protein [Abyssisolibacter fermentans]|uniref:site-2 protease family protein n=1 Tax=Abyssisolibacter fermentans TaxID=1766203 RepID=UPI00083325C0|nr:site-2 protease family protein [Abyssisolibacter fermentans]
MTEKLIRLPALLIAIVCHEFAHGYVAYKLGDNTAKNRGRLTLNPLKHLDPIGFLLLFTLGFGWAKPVPINPLYFKDRKLGTILVSIAGPLTNFALAILTALLITLLKINNNLILSFVLPIFWYNIALGVFNLIPLPPLDGSKILASLLPNKYEYLFYKYEKYLYIILIVLIMTDTINVILHPLIGVIFNFILNLVSILT